VHLEPSIQGPGHLNLYLVTPPPPPPPHTHTKLPPPNPHTHTTPTHFLFFLEISFLCFYETFLQGKKCGGGIFLIFFHWARLLHTLYGLFMVHNVWWWFSVVHTNKILSENIFCKLYISGRYFLMMRRFWAI
jgi:hypothetical protein